MKLHLTHENNLNLITGYENGWVEINGQRYTNNLIVLPEKIITNWEASTFANLSEDQFIQIALIKPEVVLLGTGEKHQFLHPKIVQCLTERSVPLECMTTPAACRTYNILMSEGRNIVAALLI